MKRLATGAARDETDLLLSQADQCVNEGDAPDDSAISLACAKAPDDFRAGTVALADSEWDIAANRSPRWESHHAP